MDGSVLIVLLALLPFIYDLIYNVREFVTALIACIVLAIFYALTFYFGSMAPRAWKSRLNPGFWRQHRALSTHSDASIDDLQRIESFKLPTRGQDKCPLFVTVPAEIRDIIYDYVFADYEDLEHPYDMDTCYRRPGYFGPRRTHTAFLRTCQAVYQEAWFMPWTNAQHTFYFAAGDRCPKRTTQLAEMRRLMAAIHELHPELSEKCRETGDVQIFAQLCALERTRKLQWCLNTPHFFPRSVTVTIRHTDCWSWESDHPLYIDATWIRKTIFPAHIKTFRIQLESLKRKKVQVDWMTGQMIKKWYLQRDDDSLLIPNGSAETQLWVGSSTWNNQRWVRDEDDSMPDVLEFYLATVTFHVSKEKILSPETLPMAPNLHVPANISSQINPLVSCLSTSEMQQKGITAGTPASKAIETVYPNRR